MNNNIERIHYVYAHVSPIDREIFYIGVGKNDRVIDGARFRNKKWKSKVYSNVTKSIVMY
jgi:hypothetical protein